MRIVTRVRVVRFEDVFYTLSFGLRISERFKYLKLFVVDLMVIFTYLLHNVDIVTGLV